MTNNTLHFSVLAITTSLSVVYRASKRLHNILLSVVNNIYNSRRLILTGTPPLLFLFIYMYPNLPTRTKISNSTLYHKNPTCLSAISPLNQAETGLNQTGEVKPSPTLSKQATYALGGNYGK